MGSCLKLRSLDGDDDRALVTFDSHRLACIQHNTHPYGQIDPAWEQVGPVPVIDSPEGQPALHDKEHAIMNARCLGNSGACPKMKAGYDAGAYLARSTSQWHVADASCIEVFDGVRRTFREMDDLHRRDRPPIAVTLQEGCASSAISRSTSLGQVDGSVIAVAGPSYGRRSQTGDITFSPSPRMQSW